MKEIKLYTSSTCPHCYTAKDYLSKEGIPYTERNVSNDPEAMKEFRELKVMGVPTFVIGDEVIVGFDKEAVLKAMND
ncbi:glutaredoxin family protein [Guggenheimella bovis]